MMLKFYSFVFRERVFFVNQQRVTPHFDCSLPECGSIIYSIGRAVHSLKLLQLDGMNNTFVLKMVRPNAALQVVIESLIRGGKLVFISKRSI